MKKILFILFVSVGIWCCGSSKKEFFKPEKKFAIASDTIRIANDSLQYEIIIIDVGFNSWLLSNAQPRNFYSQSYLESRNRFWVMEWNNRVLSPTRFNANLYEMQIDYQSNVDYGYEVNYLLFNYLTYFQIVNRQRLGGFSARI